MQPPAGEGITASADATYAIRHGAQSRSTRLRGDLYVLTSSRSLFPTLKKGTRFSGTLTLSPVLGLRPFRELRCRMRKLPKPRSSTLSPLASASVMLSKTVFTMSSVSFFVRLDSLETSSMRSALVMSPLPPREGHRLGVFAPQADRACSTPSNLARRPKD